MRDETVAVHPSSLSIVSRDIKHAKCGDGEHHSEHKNLVGNAQAVVFIAEGAAQEIQVVDDGHIGYPLPFALPA